MIMKCHNHRLQTNTLNWGRDTEHIQTKHKLKQQALFLTKMIAKQEEPHHKTRTPPPHAQREQKQLECAVDGAPSQIPVLKFVTHPAPPCPTHAAWLQQQNENSVQYVFYLLFGRTHTKFGIKILEFHKIAEINDIWSFDLIPRSPAFS